MRLWVSKERPRATENGCTTAVHEDVKKTEFPEDVKN